MATTTKKKATEVGIISVKKLAEKSGIGKEHLYAIFSGRYNDTLDPNEKTALANAIFDGTRDLYKFLGFHQEAPRRIAKSS